MEGVGLRPLRGLFDLFIDLSTIERWNDFPRPVMLTELDKQAHKAVIAFILGKIEEHVRKDKLKKNDGGKDTLRWKLIVAGLIFEALQRSVFKDMKPHIYNRLQKAAGKSWDTKTLELFEREGYLSKKEFPQIFKRFEEYVECRGCIEERIIRASHLISTFWEFELIYKIAPDFVNTALVREELKYMLEQYYDIEGVKQFFLSEALKKTIDLLGQLRFQKRWSQTPRIPATTVLGHMFFVASLSYFIIHLACSSGDEKKQKLYRIWFRNIDYMFWGGIFHDMLELFTRDIVSPVKDLLDDIFKDKKKGEKGSWKSLLERYENNKLDEFLETLPDYLEVEMRFLLGRSFNSGMECENRDAKHFDKEFLIRALDPGTGDVIPLKQELLIGEKKQKYRENIQNTYEKIIDGRLIRFSDLLSALLEASYSVFCFGVKSKHLINGLDGLSKPDSDLRKLAKELKLDLQSVWTNLGEEYKELNRRLEDVRKRKMN